MATSGENSIAISIDPSGLDPLVLALGEMVGLLAVDGDSITMVDGWFSDPLGYTRTAAAENPDALIAVITQLLGSVGGNALGIPVEDPNLLGTWYPIQWNKEPTGAYVVAYTPADAPKTRVIGLGVRASWTTTVSEPVAAGAASGVEAQIWGMAPLIALGDGDFSVALATEGRPLSVGASLSGTDGANLFDGVGISLAGVRATGTLDVANGSDPLSFTLVFTQLKTPESATASDVSLADLEALSADEVLSIVAALALSALSDATDGDARLNYVLPALGLGTVVPQVATPVPLLGWAEMAELVAAGKNPSQPFLTWFLALVSDPAVGKAWLSAVAGVIGGTPPATSGSGTREDPLAIAIFSAGAAGTLSLTLGSETNEAGVRMLYPGIEYAAQPAVVSGELVLVINAMLELAQINLSSTGAVSSSGPSSLQGRAGVTMRNPDANVPLFAGTIAGETYQFGSLVAGLSLSPGLQIMPAFMMVDVITPNGKYPALDFTQPAQVAQVALQELIDTIVSQLKGLLGLTANPDDPFGQPVGALIGLIAPRLPNGVTWPASLVPPLSSAALLDTIQHPVTALSQYYFSLLSSTVGGNSAFSYMLAEFGSLLSQVGAPAIAVRGSGLVSDPWRVSLVAADMAELIAYRDDGKGAPAQLTFGLGLQSSINIGQSNTLGLEFLLSVIQLSFGADGLPALGAWLPRIGFLASLPQQLSSPKVADASVSVSQASASASWLASSGWVWNMEAGAPTLTVGQDVYPIGSDLTFSDSTELDALVMQQAATFAPLLVRLLGAFATRTNWPAAYALDALLGLLPNLGPALPVGINWPADMPVLTPTSFSDPVGDIKAQLAALTANPSFLSAACRVLAWALSPNGVVPAVPGAGTLESPLEVPLGLPLGLRVWSGSGGALGLGFGRTDDVPVAGLIITTDVTVRALEVQLGAQAVSSGPIPVPSITLQVEVKAASGALATATDGSPILALTGGVILSLDQSGAITANPLALISLGGSNPQLLDATSLSADQLVYESLNAAFQAIATPLASNTTFGTVYSVLTDLGLVLARTENTDPYGITPSGWSGLISDPTTWLTDRALVTLADPTSRAELETVLALLLGRTETITVPVLLSALFQALDIVTGPDTGYTLRPDAVIALASHPVQTLIARAEALLNDPTLLASLITQLAGSTGPLPLGPLTWAVVDGAVVQLAVPATAPIVIGGIVALSGTTQIDLRNGTLTGATRAYVPSIGVALTPVLQWSLTAPPAHPLIVQLTWGSAETPSAEPLTLYPFVQDTFIAQLLELGPTQALSSFVTMIFDPYVLQPYPVARAVLSPLGLVVSSADNTWHLKSLLGLFDNPLGWLLSDAVIGANGQLNIHAVSKLLAGIPSASVASSIYIKQLGVQGVELGGLPYGVSFTLATNAAQTLLTFAGAVTDLAIGGASPVASLSIDVGLSLDASYQPGVSGLLTVTESTTKLGVSTGYNADGFLLSIVSANSGPSLTLVPFAGWQSLAQVAAQAMSLVVQQLTTQLLDQLALKPDTAPFVAKLRTAAGPSELNVGALVTSLSSATTADQVLTAALNWLSDRLSLTGAAGTVQAIITLLTPQITGLSAVGGLLSFAPSASIPLTLLLGRDTGNLLGLWAELALPQTGVVQIQVPRTGVGFETSANWPVTFSFGLSVLAPIVDSKTGPAFNLSYDASSGRVKMYVDPQQSGNGASAMNVELLPTFFGNQPQGIESWLIQVLTQVLPRYASIVVLNLKPVRQWLDNPIVSQKSKSGAAAPSPGDLFVGGQILLREGADKDYVLNSLDSLLALSPGAFLAGFLKALLAEEIQVVAIGTKGGGIFLENDAKLGYGVRLYAPDLELESLAEVTFQIGADDSEWIVDAGGPASLNPGVVVYVPIPADSPEFQNTTLGLVNVGIDVHGAHQAPLLQLSRFELGAVSPRFLGLFTFSDLSKPVIGGSVSVEKVGFAVAPNSLSSGPKLNPIAANMLGSGAASAPADSKNPPTDPTLSARVAYVEKLSAGFIDATGKLTDEVIVQVQQSFGPLSVQQVGFRWNNDTEILGFLFSGGLDVGPLAMQVVDLSVDVPITDPTNYDGYGLDLEGLAVSFTTSSVMLAGALLKYTDAATNVPSYDGVVLLKVGTFSLTAAGSYTTIEEDPPNKSPNSPSFFVFAASGTPIGGPPAFFVRGLSAGFGYNRSLKLPTAAEVPSNLLVMGSLDPSAVFGDSPTPSSALEKLHDSVLPEVGSYWLAAGVHFTTFSLLDSVALLAVTFGNTFSIGLLGVSRLTLPPLVESPSSALLYIELGLSVTIQPSLGLIAATAQLTPNSFVLDKACKLTGGFAFYIWFAPNAHAGDFVLTVGGYNANYTPPDYYPVVPRLGLSWPMTCEVGSISILGNTYFALTPNAIMCGGLLDLQFSAGPIRAWFLASADFLIAWKPFYYDIRIELSVGVAFTATLFGVTVTLKAELGAGLELWGPPTAGVAHVSWFVISFSVPIGDQNKKLDTQTIDHWDDFAKNFLPPPGPSQPKSSETGTMLAAASALTDTDTAKNVLTLAIPQGQITQASSDGQNVAPPDPSIWTIQRIGFAFAAQTPIPVSSVIAADLTPLAGASDIGVRPMAVSALISNLTFELIPEGETDPYPLASANFALAANSAGAPMALWDGAPFDNKSAPATTTTIPGVLLGATLLGNGYLNINEVGPIALSVFDNEELDPLNLPLSTNTPYTPAAPYTSADQATALARLMSSVMDPAVIIVRNAILEKLRAYKLVAPGDPNLSILSTQAPSVYQAPPLLARLAQTLAPAVSNATRAQPAAMTAAPAAAPLSAPRLQAMTRRYTVSSAARDPLQPSAGRTFARAVAPRQLKAVEQSGTTLHDGGVAVWSVDPRTSSHLNLSGALKAKALCFDRRGELCGEHHVSATPRAPTKQTLAPKTATLALIAAAEELPSTAGWLRSTPLIRVSSRVLLGDGCLVRPQGVVRGRDIGPHALLTPAEMLAASQVRGARGVHTGWITTMLPAHLNRADVFVAGTAADVELALVVERDGRDRREPVKPARVRKVEGGVVLSVDIQNAALHGWTRVMVRPAKAEQLRGVLGFEAKTEATASAPQQALAARESHAVLSSARRVGDVQRANGRAPDLRPIRAQVAVSTDALKESA
jgi:hypothetical protein